MSMRRRMGIETLRVVVPLLLACVLPAAAGGIEIDTSPGGSVAMLAAWGQDGHLIYVAAPSEEEPALVVLVEYGEGAWRIVYDEIADTVAFVSLQDDGVPGGLDRPAAENLDDTREAALAVGLLDAAEETGDVFLPPELLRIRDALGAVTPRKQVLQGSPGHGGQVPLGCGSAPTRRECDECCDKVWRQDREDCRAEHPADSDEGWKKQQRCMMQAALMDAHCSLMCSLKPVKPEPPGGGIHG